MSESCHSVGRRATRTLRAAVRVLAKLRRFEFLAGDPDLGLALNQLELYLLRVSEGQQPYTLGPRVFLDGLRLSVMRELERLEQRRKPNAQAKSRRIGPTK